MFERRSFIKALSLLAVAGFLNPKHLLGYTGDSALESVSKREALPTVLRVFNKKATFWDYTSAPYVDFIDYNELKKMLSAALIEYTGTNGTSEAWRRILPGYITGKKIAIKPNLNNTGIGYSKAIMTSPQLISAVIEGLIEADFSVQDIIVYDLTARINKELAQWLNGFKVKTVFRPKYDGLLEKLYSRLHLAPQDQDTNAPIRMRSTITDDLGDMVTCYIPNVLTHADYLINLPVFKAHQFVLQSGALKNHFGTVRFSNHNAYPVVLHGGAIEKNIVDINSNEHITRKTSIIIADCLYGAPCFTRGAHGRVPTRWRTLSTGPSPSSLFISSDPVALESVLADYIIREQEAAGYSPYSHQYLHDAMELGLGVHEHRGQNGRYEAIDFQEVMV